MNKNILKSFETAPGVLGRPTFPQWCNALWDQGYSGPTVVHWLHGRPQMIEMQAEGKRVVIDNPKPRQTRKPAEFKPQVQQAPAPWNRNY